MGAALARAGRTFRVQRSGDRPYARRGLGSPMQILSAPRDAFRFPAGCVECGAPPTRSFSLVLPRGAEPGKLDAPLCARHAERKSLGQLGWIAGGALAGLAGMIPGWAIALFGLAVIPAGIAEYVMLGKVERRGGLISGHWLEIAVYRVLGREGVLVLLVLTGALIFALGMHLWRKAHQRQA